MKNFLKSALVALAFAFPAFAAEETEAWYLSNGDEYLVQEALHESLYALLSISEGDEVSVYLFFDDEDCLTEDGDVYEHNPLLINGQLVKMSQYCDDIRRYFFPSSEAGRKHLIDQFIKKNVVEIKSHDDSFRTLFSAKGFTKLYRKMLFENEAI
ncbi:hypothetical protein [Thaumasiovibrio subtropicus]|uniref:hypothetical protein n=1 Tax=Thaumasiovibrio subtropicus TaxID=1891207 RepID=UPI000B35BD8F|nr:hypothetical protein [Thaumasiovibrio subtropicus]